MKVIGDLPLEVLDEIFSWLDRESLISASNVCLSWRKVIHELTSLSALKCDSDVKEKLEKCGWIFGEHDFQNCNCIKLNTGLFQFIGNVPLFCDDVIQRYDNLYSLLSKNKLLVYSDHYSDSVLMYDLHDWELKRNYLFDDYLPPRTEEINGKCFEVEESIRFAVVQDKTLVIYYIKDFDEDDDNEFRAWQEENGSDADSDDYYDNIGKYLESLHVFFR